MRFLSLIFSLFVISSFSVAAAQRDGVSVTFGAFYANVDSGLGSSLIGEGGTTGTYIDFESDLMLEETSTQPFFELMWQFKQRHFVSLNHFQLNRQGTRVIVSDFDIGEETFQAGALLSSRLDLGLWQLRYGYAFYQSESSSIGATLGLHMIDLDVAFNGLAASNLPGDDDTVQIDAEAGFRSKIPLPNLGLYYQYGLTEDFYLQLDGQYFYLDIDQLDAGLLALEAGVEYYPYPNFSIYLGASYYQVKALYTQDVTSKWDVDWDIKLEYWGPMLAAKYAF